MLTLSGKQTAIIDTLQVTGRAFYEQCFAGEGKEVTSSSLDFMSSMTENLISEVFKRPVLWDHRTKDYHNRDFVDKGWRNLSQTLHLYLVYT